MSVGLVIPTLNAEKELGTLLDAVLSQTRIPDDILVVDSSSDDNTVELAKSYPGVRTMEIRREDFDHGGTRQLALESVQGEYVLFLTQDALPADEHYVERLLDPFDDSLVAMASGRQIPRPGARRFVQLVQEHNYPSEPNVRSSSDIESLGIKAFFASDACSAYRSSALVTIGGIPRPCSTNEDMLAAARLLRAGFRVAYVSDACVIHSHNLTLREQFRRNRAVGAFLTVHGNELEVPSEIGEGVELAKKVSETLLKEGRICELASFALDCVARFLGNRAGRSIK